MKQNPPADRLSPPVQKSDDGEPDNTDKIIHDLRSSLNVIIGYSELMLDEVMGKMTEAQCDSIKDILTSGQHLMNIVNDIVLWKKPGRAKNSIVG